MLRINRHAMNLDLTILGWIRQGEIRCPSCGCAAHWDKEAKTNRLEHTDPLYGREASGQHCDRCGVALITVAV